jgi:hypothetical protein
MTRDCLIRSRQHHAIFRTVTSIDDLTVALQRCYLQARLQPTGPTFLSIPMNFMLERTGHTTFKKTHIIEDTVPRTIGNVAYAKGDADDSILQSVGRVKAVGLAKITQK